MNHDLTGAIADFEAISKCSKDAYFDFMFKHNQAVIFALRFTEAAMSSPTNEISSDVAVKHLNEAIEDLKKVDGTEWAKQSIRIALTHLDRHARGG